VIFYRVGLNNFDLLCSELMMPVNNQHEKELRFGPDESVAEKTHQSESELETKLAL
jgi:hypothetical protein